MVGGTPSNTTQTTKVELPAWVDKASQQNYNRATEIANQPFKQFKGPRVADLGSATQQGIAGMTSSVGSAQQGYDKAAGIFSDINDAAGGLSAMPITAAQTAAGNTSAGMTRAADTYAGTTQAANTRAGLTRSANTSAMQTQGRDIVAQMFPNMDIGAYMNPYVGEVVDKSLADLDRSRQMAINSNASAAAAAGAFGGSRQGITDAVTNSEAARNAGLMSAQLRSSAFDKASGLMASDMDRALAAAQSNQADTRAVTTANADRMLQSDTANANRRLQSDTNNVDRILQSDTNNANRRLQSDTANVDRILQSDTTNSNRRLQSDTANVDRALQSDTNNVNRDLQSSMANADRSLSADQATQKNILDTFLAKTGAMGSAASGIMGATESGQQAKMQDFAGLLQSGALQQQNAQAKIDSAREKFDERRNYNIDNLNLRLSALGMSPYGKTENVQKSQTQGLAPMDLATSGLGIMTLLMGLSDDNTKTDKVKLGKFPGTDLEAWAFRYKDDPKTYPKSIGVMASDVEKKMPQAVHRIGKTRVINYGMIGEAMANGNA